MPLYFKAGVAELNHTCPLIGLDGSADITLILPPNI
jgi:hypothetical protein